MFNTSQRSALLRETDDLLRSEVNNYFQEILPSIKQELANAEVPEEEHERIIKDIKHKVHLDIIKKFQENVKSATIRNRPGM